MPMREALRRDRIETAVLEALPFAVVLAGFVALWEAACRGFAIKAYILPAPSAIWAAAWAGFGPLMANAGVTAWEAVAGFVIGSALGALLGVAFAYSRFLARGFKPLPPARQRRAASVEGRSRVAIGADVEQQPADRAQVVR